MSNTVTQPIDRIPIGQFEGPDGLVDVKVHPEYLRFFESLRLRAGGTVGPGTKDVQEQAQQMFESIPSDPAAREALQAVDELRNELATARGLMQDLRAIIEEQAAQIAALRHTEDLRQRVEQIEERLL